MSDEKQQDKTGEPARVSLKTKIGVGAALVALPIASAWVYHELKVSNDQQNRDEEEGANYDVAKLSQIDPALVTYHQVAPIATGMRGPRAIAVDAGGRVLVAGEKMVRILNGGEKVLDIALQADPFCLTTGADGTVYVGFKDHIETFNAEGKPLERFAAFSEKTLLTGLAVHGNDLYAADAGRRLVVRCDIQGKVLNTIGENSGAKDLGLVLPSPFLNVAASGEQVIVSNPGRHRVDVYSPNGTLQHFWGKQGTAVAEFIGCCNPSQLALLADGRIVTAEKGVTRVKVYRPDGTLDGVVAKPDLFVTAHRGAELAVSAEGNILVLEPNTTSIRVFVANGAARAAGVETSGDKTAGAI